MVRQWFTNTLFNTLIFCFVIFPEQISKSRGLFSVQLSLQLTSFARGASFLSDLMVASNDSITFVFEIEYLWDKPSDNFRSSGSIFLDSFSVCCSISATELTLEKSTSLCNLEVLSLVEVVVRPGRAQ